MTAKTCSHGMSSVLWCDVCRPKLDEYIDGSITNPPKCDQCKQVKADVTWRRDPYDWDVNNKENWRWLCDECHDAIADDI